MNPAVVVRIAVCARDGDVLRRYCLCWAHPPRAASLVGEIASRCAAARSAGLTLQVEALTPNARAALRLAGLLP